MNQFVALITALSLCVFALQNPAPLYAEENLPLTDVIDVTENEPKGELAQALFSSAPREGVPAPCGESNCSPRGRSRFPICRLFDLGRGCRLTCVTMAAAVALVIGVAAIILASSDSVSDSSNS